MKPWPHLGVFFTLIAAVAAEPGPAASAVEARSMGSRIRAVCIFESMSAGDGPGDNEGRMEVANAAVDRLRR